MYTVVSFLAEKKVGFFFLPQVEVKFYICQTKRIAKENKQVQAKKDRGIVPQVSTGIRY